MNAPQGRRLIALMKRRPCTYREMLQASESCSPWRRIDETLRDDDHIVKGLRNGLVTWRVVTATGWTGWTA